MVMGHKPDHFCYIDDLVSAIIKFTNPKIKFSGPLNLETIKNTVFLKLLK